MSYIRFLHLRLLYVFLALFIGSRCSSSQDIDPRLSPFVENFVKDAKRYGVEVDPGVLSSLQYGDLEGPLLEEAVGLCMPLKYGPFGIPLPKSSRVIVEPYYPYNSYRFKALVYHELSHCLLYRPHEGDDETDLMYPYIHSDENFYKENWEQILEQLFTGKKTPKIVFFNEAKFLRGK